MSDQSCSQLGDVARVVAYRIREDLKTVDSGSASWLGLMESHAKDLDRLADKLAAPLLVPRLLLLDEISVRNKIAEWYGAEWNPKDSTFYETDDTGTQDTEDEGAMHAYRGFKWAQELARPMPTQEEIETSIRQVLADMRITMLMWGGGTAERPTLDNLATNAADAVLALINGGAKCVCLHDESGTEVSALCAEHGGAK